LPSLARSPSGEQCESPSPTSFPFTSLKTRTAVGGIKEKVLGAHRAGIRKVILPERNRKDVQADLPESLKREVEIEHVGTVEALLEAVWGRDVWVGGASKVEARL
jgi:ATP-dependent Lon protease